MVGYPVVGNIPRGASHGNICNVGEFWSMYENFMGIIGPMIPIKLSWIHRNTMTSNGYPVVIYREVQVIAIFATRTQWTASIDSRSILSDKQYADIANVLQFLMVTSPSFSFHFGQDA